MNILVQIGFGIYFVVAAIIGISHSGERMSRLDSDDPELWLEIGMAFFLILVVICGLALIGNGIWRAVEL